MNSNAIAAKKKVDSAFMKKGVFIAIMSGVTYGLYTGFLTLGMARGIWGADWYGANTSGLSVFAITYVLAALGSGVNDTTDGIVYTGAQSSHYLCAGCSGLRCKRYHQWYLDAD